MQKIITNDDKHVRTITLNRPEKRNALGLELVAELTSAFREAADDDTIRVVVLAGEGKAFCAGADLRYLQTLSTNSPLENLYDSRTLMEMFALIRHFPKPVIAKVQGAALAGGCGLALACDVIVASEESSFGFTETRIGFVPAIVAKLLIERIGMGKAREHLLRGAILKAPEALALGMINHVVRQAALNAATESLAKEFASGTSPQAVRLTKELLREIESLSLPEAMKRGAEINALSRTSKDFHKGVSSFVKKVRPSWDEE